MTGLLRLATPSGSRSRVKPDRHNLPANPRPLGSRSFVQGLSSLLLTAACLAVAVEGRASPLVAIGRTTADSEEAVARAGAAKDQMVFSKSTVKGPFAYKVTFGGLKGHPELAELLPAISKTVKRLEHPPISHFLLQRRARRDLEIMTRGMHSRGYFDGRVDVTLIGSHPPFEVHFAVEPNQLYRLDQPVLTVIPGEVATMPPDWKRVGLQAGDPAVSARVLAAQEALVTVFKERGYGFAKVVRRRARLDRENKRLMVTFDLEPGEKVRLSGLSLKVTGSANQPFLRQRVPWQSGTGYHPQRVEEARKGLVDTGLFSAVRLKLTEKPDENGLWGLDTELTERKHRTWRVGGGLSTDQGLTLKGGWEHRNFRGSAERVSTDVNLGNAENSLSASFEKPDFQQTGQNLTVSIKGDEIEEEAFERTALEVRAGLSRPFGDRGRLSLTLSYRLSRVLELSLGQDVDYSAVSLPVGLKLDRSDDLLDATRGWRFKGEVTPVLEISGEGASYVRWRNQGRIYRKLHDSPRLVAAARAEVAGTMGAERNEIPADDRFYAGGGGSVRGYAYQLAGPLEDNGMPRGGRSLLTFGTELRLRFTEKIGLVAFVDGGRTYESSYPDTFGEMLYGTGLGARYATPLGPLRLDVAIPLRRRDDVDDAFQVYMSIGQAF